MFSFLCLERGSPSEGRGGTEGASLLIVYTKCSEAYVSSPPKNSAWKLFEQLALMMRLG